MPPLTRGPLPAGVYWRRRVFVLALAGTLVFVIANLLGAGSDGSSGDVPAARQAGVQVDASETVTVGKQDGKKRKRKGQDAGPTQGPTYNPNVLVEPDGNCRPADIRVTPQIEYAVAGQPVTIGLSLQTMKAEACYWRLGHDKLTVRITDGDEEVWTSRQCRKAVPRESIVVRRVVATVVEMTWNARESDEGCSTRTDWVGKGDYTIATAALGGEPTEAEFDLPLPTPETVTVTPDPDPKKGAKKGPKGNRGDSGQQPTR